LLDGRFPFWGDSLFTRLPATYAHRLAILTPVNDEPALGIDHVVIAVEDLDESASALTRVLGRRPSWRGRHPSYGTANVLFRLENAYIELLAIDLDAPVGGGAWTAFLRTFLAEEGEGLFALAMGTSNVAATVAAIRGRGMAVDEPLEGSGVDLGSGATRSWVNARVPVIESKGTACFFIEHRSPPEALPMAPVIVEASTVAASVEALSIETSDATGAATMWHGVIGLPMEADGEATRFSLSNGSLLVFPGASGAMSHRWQRLVLGVPSVPALADRLDAERIDFRQGEFREGAGVMVECCGVEILMTETV
jgi:catechol 2,3-dioxygenase-like lactoylglutathione lyase family enzyme